MFINKLNILKKIDLLKKIEEAKINSTLSGYVYLNSLKEITIKRIFFLNFIV